MISANSNRRPDDAASSGGQRRQVEDSERKANEKQPGSFKDEAMDEKVVEISPPGSDKRPIEGLDPD